MAATSEIIATGTVVAGDDPADPNAWTVSFTPAQATDLTGWDTVEVAASVEDAAGNESQTTATFATDFDAPSIIIDDISDGNQIGLIDLQGDLEITGETDAEVGQPVDVTFNGVSISGAEVISDGVWSATIPQSVLEDVQAGADADDLAQVNVSATVEDAAGNPAEQPATVTVQADFSGPSISIDPITGDNILNIAERDDTDGVSISGRTNNVEAGQDVTVTVDGGDPIMVQTEADGTWSATLPQADAGDLADGASIEVTADVDDTDGIPADQGSVTLTTDFAAPTMEIDTPIAGEGNVLNIDERGEDLTISGTTTGAEDGQDVTLTLAGETYTATVSGDAWSVDIPSTDLASLPNDEEINVEATVEDAAGNPADPDTATFNTDFTAPEVTIAPLPLGDDAILNAAESGNDLLITGTATDTDRVTVTFNGVAQAPADVINGDWTVTIPSADLQGLNPDATINVEAEAEDDADNIGTADVTSFATDFNPPSLTVDPLEIGAFLNIDDADGAVTVTGTVADNDGEDVVVSVDGVDGQDVTASVDPQGDWTATFAARALAALSDGETEFTVSTQDAAGNPATATSAPFTVDLTAPEIKLDGAPQQGFVLDVAEREDADGLGFTTSESGNATVTLTFTSAGGSVDLSLTETLGDIPETGGLFDFPLTPADLAMLKDETDYTVEIGITDAAGNTDTDGFDLSTDFEPSISLDEVVEGGVLILADIDPTNVSVSGTTSGVEAGEVVTVTIREEAGSSIFTNSTATVQGDGTWSLDLPESAVNGLDAGQTYDVQADVSNAAGRDAPQAQEQVVAYEAGAFILAEIGRASGTATFGVFGIEEVFAQENDDGFELTLQFDSDALTFQTPVPSQVNNDFSFVSALPEGGSAFTFIGINQVDTSTNQAIRVEDFSVPFFSVLSDVDDTNVPLSFELISDNFGDTSVEIGTDGNDNLTASNLASVIQGRGDNDEIELSGAGVNTVLFEADPSANGFDTVTDFSVGGPLPDRLGFAGLNNEDLRGDGGTFELLSGTDSVGADTGLIVFTTAMTDLTAGSVQSALDGLTDLADGDMLYFLASDGSDAQLYEVQVQAVDDTVTDMAKFEGLGDLTGMTEANVLGFDTTGQPV